MIQWNLHHKGAEGASRAHSWLVKGLFLPLLALHGTSPVSGSADAYFRFVLPPSSTVSRLWSVLVVIFVSFILGPVRLRRRTPKSMCNSTIHNSGTCLQNNCACGPRPLWVHLLDPELGWKSKFRRRPFQKSSPFCFAVCISFKVLDLCGCCQVGSWLERAWLDWVTVVVVWDKFQEFLPSAPRLPLHPSHVFSLLFCCSILCRI